MNPTFKVLIISMFVGLFVINIYFRAKVMKAYKYLIKNNIKFSATDILSKSKMENNVIPRYPKHEAEIRNFVDLMKRSLLLSLGVVILILSITVIYHFFL